MEAIGILQNYRLSVSHNLIGESCHIFNTMFNVHGVGRNCHICKKSANVELIGIGLCQVLRGGYSKVLCIIIERWFQGILNIRSDGSCIHHAIMEAVIQSDHEKLTHVYHCCIDATQLILRPRGTLAAPL